MTRDEVKKVIRIIKATYPSFASNVELVDLVEAWSVVLAEDNAKDIEKALMRFIRTDTKGFPPSLGQLTTLAMPQVQETEESELAVWCQVYKAICNSNYNAREEFEKLPSAAKMAIGRPEQLQAWAMMDASTVLSVGQSNFLRSYREAVKVIANNAALPPSQRKVIEAPSFLKLEEDKRAVVADFEKRQMPQKIKEKFAKLKL